MSPVDVWPGMRLLITEEMPDSRRLCADSVDMGVNMKKCILDGERIVHKNQLHDTLAGSLGFPEWYGRNLDALYDCLTDIREEAEICILQMPLLEEKLGRYAVLLLKVLKDAAGENNAIHLKMEEKP